MWKLVAAMILAGTAASAQLYECTTSNSGRDDWVSKKFFIEYDSKGETAKALDSVIQSVSGDFIPVQVTRRKNDLVKLNWTVKGAKTSNDGSTHVSYSFRFDMARQKFSVKGNLHGYDNNIHGSGTCKIRS